MMVGQHEARKAHKSPEEICVILDRLTFSMVGLKVVTLVILALQVVMLWKIL